MPMRRAPRVRLVDGTRSARSMTPEECVAAVARTWRFPLASPSWAIQARGRPRSSSVGSAGTRCPQGFPFTHQRAGERVRGRIGGGARQLARGTSRPRLARQRCFRRSLLGEPTPSALRRAIGTIGARYVKSARQGFPRSAVWLRSDLRSPIRTGARWCSTPRLARTSRVGGLSSSSTSTPYSTLWLGQTFDARTRSLLASTSTAVTSMLGAGFA